MAQFVEIRKDPVWQESGDPLTLLRTGFLISMGYGKNQGGKSLLFEDDISEEEIRRERSRARELRQSQWWKNRIATGRCHYCGTSVPPRELTLDHIVPITRGGKSTRGNCVPACKECNNRKKHLLPVEWEEYLGKLKEAKG
jgi:5-methylcytosine-specific restriction enzyme A